MRVLILGAGGHGQVVADILHGNLPHTAMIPVGFLDDNVATHGQRILDLPVLGPVSELHRIEHDAVIIGIGNNRIRQEIAESLSHRGEKLVNAVHPSAVIGRNCHMGLGVVVCAGVVVSTGTNIGNHVVLNTSCTVDHHNDIGDFAHIGPGAHLGGDVRIGPGTLVGIGSSVIPQCAVGAWSVIGAGSAVTRQIPDRVVAVGVPAQVLRSIDQEALF